MSGYRIVKESWAELSQRSFKDIIKHQKKDSDDDVTFVVIKVR